MAGSVFLNNLDDFIAPSQACVNPFVTAKSDGETNGNSTKPSRKHGRVTIETEFGQSDFDEGAIEANLIKPKFADSRKVATVTLNDCLACSGCVTSAEAILVQEQSIDKLVKVLQTLQKCHNTLVIQVSPNSQASIAEFLGMDVKDFFLRMATALKSLGVKYVLDSSAGADVALVESREEFLQRFKNGRSKVWAKPETSTADSATSISIYDEESTGERVSHLSLGVPTLATSLPVLTSHCPGWVCYAEKTAPQALPYLSTVKSAQQIVGSIMKSILQGAREEEALAGAVDDDHLSGDLIDALQCLSLDKSVSEAFTHSADEHHKPRCNAFIVSVQPCFDKKLEASRKDFFHAAQGVNEVDLVLSTTELWQLIEGEARKWYQAEYGVEGEPIEEAEEEVVLDCDDDEIRCKRTKAHNQIALLNKLTVDSMDFDSPSPVVKTSETDAGEAEGQRKKNIENTFAFVRDYLQSLQPDKLGGSDDVEALFRSFSPLSQKILAAAEKNLSSGGYAEYLFRYAAEKVFGVDIWNEPLVYKEGRNADMAEVDLTAMLSAKGVDVSSVEAVGRPLKFARAYGFRNVQTVMLKMKRGACDFDLVEIMACPSGCSNGGGQLKSLSSLVPQTGGIFTPKNPVRGETPQESKSRIKGVETAFHDNLQFRPPEESPLVRYLYDSRRLGAPLSDRARQLLHTRYHSVPKLENIAPLAAKW